MVLSHSHTNTHSSINRQWSNTRRKVVAFSCQNGRMKIERGPQAGGTEAEWVSGPITQTDWISGLKAEGSFFFREGRKRTRVCVFIQGGEIWGESWEMEVSIFRGGGVAAGGENRSWRPPRGRPWTAPRPHVHIQNNLRPFSPPFLPSSLFPYINNLRLIYSQSQHRFLKFVFTWANPQWQRKKVLKLHTTTFITYFWI